MVGVDVGDEGVERAGGVREGAGFRESEGTGGEGEEGPASVGGGSSREELGAEAGEYSERHCGECVVGDRPRRARGFCRKTALPRYV